MLWIGLVHLFNEVHTITKCPQFIECARRSLKPLLEYAIT